jgi:alpha-galactosidase
MAALTADLHALGLKVGIYTSPGPTTCAGFPGSHGHEREDADSFASWGVDYLKYDWCSAGPHTGDLPVAELAEPFAAMRAALDRLSRDIVYHICEYGWGEVWKWARERVGANAWRTTGDIEDSWDSVDRIGFGQAGLERAAGPGGWNDPDMLVVGPQGAAWRRPTRPSPLTITEQRTHLTLWVLLSAPLFLGCDIAALDASILTMLLDPDLMAIHQDPLGRQASRALVDGPIEVWRKDLAGGSSALGVFNRGDRSVAPIVDLTQLGIRHPTAVREVLDRHVLPADPIWSSLLPPHGCALLLISSVG